MCSIYFSCIFATATTLIVSSTFINLTPWVALPIIEMSDALSLVALPIDDNKIITSLLDNNKLKQNNKKFNNIKKKEFYYKTIRLSINELQVF